MGPSTTREIHRCQLSESGDFEMSAARDALAVEEPLELCTRERSLAVIMRTPGHDLELVRGFLQGEGVLRDGEGAALHVDTEQANRVVLDMDAAVVRERWADREAITSSACGVCGASALAVLDTLARPIRSDLMWSPQAIAAAPTLLQEQQEVFARTGGLHGATLIDDTGTRLVCREDVGRHNAVDKVFGWARMQGLLGERLALVVSGRLSYEIVHKAIVAGVPLVIAVSAPSSLAVDLAERWRVTLVGFARGDRFNVYSHPSRVQCTS